MKSKKTKNKNSSFEEDSQFLARLLKKEKAAWDEFVDRYSPFIYHGIHQCFQRYAVPKRPEDIEDLYHSIFLIFLEDDYKKLRQFKGHCSLSTWVHIISTRFVIDWLRKGRKSVPLDAESEEGISLYDKLPDPDPGVEDRIYTAQKRQLLKKALELMTSEDRLLAVLIYERQMPVEEIAATMNLSKENVYIRKHRLKVKLQDNIEYN